MNTLLRIMVMVCAGSLLTGCAVGNKIAYSGAASSTTLSGQGPLLVATHDRRPYVVSGDKPATFVGLQRGGYGNPFDVNTASGRPLSESFDESLTATLRAAGFDARAVTLSHSESPESALRRLRDTAPARVLLVRLVEWKSDTYNNTRLIYDVVVEVHSPESVVLASAAFSGTENLGGSMINPPGHAKTAVPEAFRRLIGQWLSDQRISAALR